jgi:hypothetical protein
VVVCACGPSYTGGVSRRIVVQTGGDKKMRHYLKKKKEKEKEKRLWAWLKW